MTLSAPCYDRAGYWRYFELDYATLRVLDIGSSIGSYDQRAEFRGARAGLTRAERYVSLDISAAARPHVVADAHSLPFADESLDVVLANNLNEHHSAPADGVSEVRRGLAPIGIGLVAGIALALAATRLLRGLLYEVSPTDPATFAAVSAVLLLAATLAAWLPSRRAARIAPATALRGE